MPQAILEQVADEKEITVIGIIRTMPRLYAAAITLRYYAGFQIQDLADVLQLPKRSAERLMAESLAYLKKNYLQ